MNDSVVRLKRVIPLIRKKYEDSGNASQGVIDNLDALMRKLMIATREGGPKDIGFFGAMSRGKSSLINALLGCELMPVKACQTSSVVVKVKHSDSPYYRVKIHEQGGRQDTHDNLTLSDARSTLEVFGTRQGGSGDAIDYIEVEGAFPDSRVLEKGGVLVDTPGAEAAFDESSTQENVEEQNRAVRILEETDVILFVEGADYLSSVNGTAFFKEKLSRFKPLVVVNKKDKFTPELPANQPPQTDVIEMAKLRQLKSEVLKVYHTNVSTCVSCKEAAMAKKNNDEQLYSQSRIPELVNLVCNAFVNLKPENILPHALDELKDIVCKVGDVSAQKAFFLPASQQFLALSRTVKDEEVRQKAETMFNQFT